MTPADRRLMNIQPITTEVDAAKVRDGNDQTAASLPCPGELAVLVTMRQRKISIADVLEQVPQHSMLAVLV